MNSKLFFLLIPFAFSIQNLNCQSSESDETRLAKRVDNEFYELMKFAETSNTSEANILKNANKDSIYNYLAFMELKSEISTYKDDVRYYFTIDSQKNKVIAYVLMKDKLNKIKTVQDVQKLATRFSSDMSPFFALEMLQGFVEYNIDLKNGDYNYSSGSLILKNFNIYKTTTNQKFSFKSDHNISSEGFQLKLISPELAKKYPKLKFIHGDFIRLQQEFEKGVKTTLYKTIFDRENRAMIGYDLALDEGIATEPTSSKEAYTFVEQMPEFPGGEDGLMAFIHRNLKYPPYAKENDITGTVMVNFVIYEDGTVNNVKITKGIKGGCDEEAMRIVKSMPKWKPGKQGGKAVPVSYDVPINFSIE